MPAPTTRRTAKPLAGGMPQARPGEALIWTDGACQGNPGPGGWAAIVIGPDPGAPRVERSGGLPHTTNNVMEMTAALEGLRALPDGSMACVVTDSRYLHDGMTSWMAGWKRRGWKTAGGDPVKNKDLWLALESEVARHAAVRWHWVRGHVGTELNERADELAVAAAAAAARAGTAEAAGVGEPRVPAAGGPPAGAPVRITELAPAGLDVLEPLWWAMAEHHAAVAGRAWPLQDRATSWARRRAQYERWLAGEDGARAAWVLAAGPPEAPLGYAAVIAAAGSGATWDLGPEVGDLESLAVAPPARGSGIGTQLIAAARERLRARGIEHWQVSVVAANAAAARLYEREGFRPFVSVLTGRV